MRAWTRVVSSQTIPCCCTSNLCTISFDCFKTCPRERRFDISIIRLCLLTAQVLVVTTAVVRTSPRPFAMTHGLSRKILTVRSQHAVRCSARSMLDRNTLSHTPSCTCKHNMPPKTHLLNVGLPKLCAEHVAQGGQLVKVTDAL